MGGGGACAQPCVMTSSYIFRYDITSFSNLYDKAPTTSGGDDGGNCQPVCVPFYVLHKVHFSLLLLWQLLLLLSLFLTLYPFSVALFLLSIGKV